MCAPALHGRAVPIRKNLPSLRDSVSENNTPLTEAPAYFRGVPPGRLSGVWFSECSPPEEQAPPNKAQASLLQGWARPSEIRSKRIEMGSAGFQPATSGILPDACSWRPHTTAVCLLRTAQVGRLEAGQRGQDGRAPHVADSVPAQGSLCRTPHRKSSQPKRRGEIPPRKPRRLFLFIFSTPPAAFR